MLIVLNIMKVYINNSDKEKKEKKEKKKD